METDPRLRPFDYTLPESHIARFPPRQRDGGRLLDLRDNHPTDRLICALPDCLRPGDVLVVNNTRVLSARLHTRRATGGRVEVLLLSGEPDADGRVAAMVKPGRRLKPGERLTVEREGEVCEGLSVRLSQRRSDGSWWVVCEPTPSQLMDQAGQLPLPPYFQRDNAPEDAERYQTVFAGPPGAIAAPTAGLHLTPGLLDHLNERGIVRVSITLHVGVGTFRNLRPEDLDAGRLHAERFTISEHVADTLNVAQQEGRRIVAVGTTSTRCLESAFSMGRVQAGQGSTELFIQPGYRFKVVGGLLTNFHLPRSSLLMLACAFGGTSRVLSAYRHAIAAGYRFYSYGDAMLISPGQSHS